MVSKVMGAPTDTKVALATWLTLRQKRNGMDQSLVLVRQRLVSLWLVTQAYPALRFPQC